MRYWTAVIAATTSVFIIIVLLIYFTCSAYNKRKKRKYVSRKERVHEQVHVNCWPLRVKITRFSVQDDMMMRNENFVRQNFRPVTQLPTISTVQPTAPPSVVSNWLKQSTGRHTHKSKKPQLYLKTHFHINACRPLDKENWNAVPAQFRRFSKFK